MPVRSIVIELSHKVPVVEAGLRQILGAWPEFDVMPSVPAHARQRAPDLLIVDQVRACGPSLLPVASAPRTLVVAMDGQELDVRGALEAGVRGYLLVSCGVAEIINAVRAVAAGQRYLCATASSRLADKLGQPCLTLREGEVLSLVLRGQSNKEMARSLAISIGTVKAHMRSLFSKLGARCRTEALWIASERGLLTRPANNDDAPVQTDKLPLTARSSAPRATTSKLGSHSSPTPGSKETPCPSPHTLVLHPA